MLDRALGFEVASDRFDVVKEKKAKDFANMRCGCLSFQRSARVLAALLACSGCFRGSLSSAQLAGLLLQHGCGARARRGVERPLLPTPSDNSCPLPTRANPPAHPPPPQRTLCRYDQPYQVALYSLGVALEARRWHVADYEAVLPGIAAGDLQAGGASFGLAAHILLVCSLFLPLPRVAAAVLQAGDASVSLAAYVFSLWFSLFLLLPRAAAAGLQAGGAGLFELQLLLLPPSALLLFPWRSSSVGQAAHAAAGVPWVLAGCAGFSTSSLLPHLCASSVEEDRLRSRCSRQLPGAAGMGQAGRSALGCWHAAQPAATVWCFCAAAGLCRSQHLARLRPMSPSKPTA